jgi:hypothetical protein
MADAVVEEVNLRVLDHSKHFTRVASQFLARSGDNNNSSSSQIAGRQGCGNSSNGGKLGWGSTAAAGTGGAGGGKGASKGGWGAPRRGSGTQEDLLKQLQVACSQQGVQFHPLSSLAVYQKGPGGLWGKKQKGLKSGRKKWAKGKPEGSDPESDGEEEEEESTKSFFLTLSGNLDRRKYRYVPDTAKACLSYALICFLHLTGPYSCPLVSTES